MKKILPLMALVALLMSSCETYYMTSSSLRQQLQNIDPEKITDAYDFRAGLIGVALKGGRKNFYNGIQKIKVTNKAGKEFIRPVTTRTGIRLTNTSGRRVQLYFDSVFLKDSLVYGSKSHFLNLPVKPMNVDSLVKIEIQ